MAMIIFVCLQHENAMAGGQSYASLSESLISLYLSLLQETSKRPSALVGISTQASGLRATQSC